VNEDAINYERMLLVVALSWGVSGVKYLSTYRCPNYKIIYF